MLKTALNYLYTGHYLSTNPVARVWCERMACMLPYFSFSCLHASIVLLLAYCDGSAACMVLLSFHEYVAHAVTCFHRIVLLIMLPWFNATDYATCLLQLFCSIPDASAAYMHLDRGFTPLVLHYTTAVGLT